MGIINVNIDSGLQSEPFYPSASILEISTRYNETPYFQKIKREPLVFNLTFAFEDGFDDDKLRETARWLNQKTFKELYFSNQPDKKYFAIYEGSPRLFHTGADGYFEITFRTNSPYAHSNLIETGIYNQVSPTFTFTRPSPAYHPETGAEVPADTPVFVDFAGGRKGSLMEEGTTNAFNNPSFEDGTTGWWIIGFEDNTLLTSVTDDVYSGSKAVKVERVSGGLRGTGATISQKIGTRIVLTQNQSVTVSFYVKGKGNTIGKTVWAHIYASDGTNRVSQVKSYTLTGEWQRISYTLTWPYATSTTTIYGYCRVVNINIGDYFYVDAAQLEAKPYATSFIDGTRANPTTLLTLPEALPDEFGVGIAAKMLHESGAKDRTFWQAGDYYRLHYDTADSKLKMQFGEVTAEQEADWSAGDIIGVYAGRQDGKLFLQSKIAGVLGDGVESEKWRRNLLINSGNERVVGLSWTDYNLFPEIQQVLGKTVTFSIEAKTSNGADTFDFYPRPASGYAPIKSFAPTTEYEKYYFTFTYLDDDTATVLRVRHNTAQNPNNDGVLYIRNVKLELGDITTPWTPAPEDGDSKDIHIGSNSDSEEHVNAVLADFVLHDSGDIDPEGYLAGVPGGGE